MKRTGHRCAVCLGLLGATLVWLVCPTPMDRDDAVTHAQPFLDAPAERASLSPDGRTWSISAGEETAHIDAQTGALLEITF